QSEITNKQYLDGLEEIFRKEATTVAQRKLLQTEILTGLKTIHEAQLQNIKEEAAGLKAEVTEQKISATDRVAILEKLRGYYKDNAKVEEELEKEITKAK